MKDFVPLTLSASGELQMDPQVTKNLAATFVKIEEFNAKVNQLEADIKGLSAPLLFSMSKHNPHSISDDRIRPANSRPL